jgi:hypothetical protein
MTTSNTDRIRVELERAADVLPEKFAGYRNALVKAAMECIMDAAEHGDRRLNINQRFENRISQIAAQFGSRAEMEPQQ